MTSTTSSSATVCVGNKVLVGNICQEYCSKKCKTCTDTRNDCVECAEFYFKDESGNYVVENQALWSVTVIRPILNLIYAKSLRFLILLLNDIWLYNYHKIQY